MNTEERLIAEKKFADAALRLATTRASTVLAMNRVVAADRTLRYFYMHQKFARV